MAASAAIGAIDAAVVELGKSVIETSAYFEQLEVSFKTLLGSGNAATEFLNQLEQFAAKTPFEVPGLADMSRQLLSVGVASKDVIPDLKAIGDAASAMGKGQEGANQITHALTIMEARGKLSEREIMMMAYNGINGLQLLSDETGKTSAELADMIQKGLINGKVAAQLFMDAFEQKWGDGMAQQAQTVNGLMTTLRDNLRLAALALGQQLIPVIREFLQWAIKVVQGITDWVKNHQELTKYIAIGTGIVLLFVTAVAAISTAMIVLAPIVQGMIVMFTAFGGILLVAIPIVAAIGVTLAFLSDRFGGLGNVMQAFLKMAKIIWDGIIIVFKESVDAIIIGPLNKFVSAWETGFNLVIKAANGLGAHLKEVKWQIPTLDSGGQLSDIDKQMAALDQMQADAILKKSDAAQQQAIADAKVATGLNLSSAAQKANLAALTAGMEGNKKSGKSAEELKNKLQDLVKALQDVRQKAADEKETLTTEFNRAMEESAKRTADLKDQLADLATQFNRTAAEQQRMFDEQAKQDKSSVADDVIKAEEKIKTLTQEVADAQTKADEARGKAAADLLFKKQQLADIESGATTGTPDEIRKLQTDIINDQQALNGQSDLDKKLKAKKDELKKEQDAYAAEADFIKSIDADIIAARAKGQMTDLQQSVLAYQQKRQQALDDFNFKRQQAQEEYNAHVADLQASLAAEAKKAKDETDAYKKKMDQINDLLKQAEDYKLAVLKGTHDQQMAMIQAEIDAYNRLADAIARAGQGKSPFIVGPAPSSHEFGGLVNAPEGMAVPAILHGQERVIPARQASNMGGGITITIVNPSIRSDNDLAKMKQMLDKTVRDLMINYKL